MSDLTAVSWKISGLTNLYVNDLPPSTLFDREVHIKGDTLRVGFSKIKVSCCHKGGHSGSTIGKPGWN